MRKSIALSIAFFVLLLPLSSEIWKSNELGQKLMLLDADSDSGWILKSSGNESGLFHDGSPVYKKTASDNAVHLVYEGGREEILEYDGSRIIRHVIIDDGVEEEYLIRYDGDSISGYEYSMNGEVRKRISYSSFDNRLTSISGDSNGYFGYDFYSYESDEDVIRVKIGSDGKLSRDDDEVLERDSEGYFLRAIERDGIEWTLFYDDSLRLIKEISDEAVITYSYSDDGLREKRIEKGDSITIEEYDDGNALRVCEYASDELRKVRTRLSDGRVEEIRYISSVPRYRFIYDIDGSRLLEAEAL